MPEEPLPEAELWLLLGPAVLESPVAKRLARDFAAAFGPRFAVVPTDRLLLGVTGGKLTLYDLTGRPVTPPRVAVVRLAMTSLSSDREITLLRQLQAMGTELINPAESILTCVNKFWQLQRLAGAGLPVPDTRTYTDTRPDRALVGIPEPCVVKAVRGSGGHQVFLARDAATVADVQGCLRPDVPFLFQRYVAHSHGRDLRVIVVDGRPVAVGLRSSANGLMQSNVSLGGTVEPCPGRYPAAEQLAVRAAEEVGLVLAGIDLLFEEDGTFTVCEVNANVRWGERVTQVTDALIAACAGRLT
ncbi:RimK family alpha-L-glutamate ligase [Kitasatospora sp. NPDC059673]|uniref:RimK family alpha-L-glutamate ligase n=1 Tax=Kitasatospora sp. NPDC059673 TaxID=3346901 RepID=UPI003676C807